MYFASTNPATGEIVWQGKAADKHAIDSAIVNASKAFSKWSSLSVNTRIQHLEAYRDTLNRHKDKLAEAISKETGKPLWESKSEVITMVNKVDISIEAFHNRCPEITKEHPSALSITRHKPHGVIAVFGPYNFPGHLPNGHIVPALLAGNTVVFKPSELTPLVGELTLEIWKESGIPTDVLTLLQGGRETGKLIAEHPKINGLFLTGSWNTGKSLLQQFANHPEKILALEMGGNNPFIVHEVSDLASAAYLTIQSAYLTSGQRCTCARRLIVPKGTEGDTFIHELTEMTKKIRVGAYTEFPEPFMGPIVSHATAQKLLEAQEKLKKQGGKPFLEMKLLKEGTGFLSPGLMDVSEISQRIDEEFFGPFLQIIRVPNFDAALTEANHTAYGLAAGLLSDKKENYEKFFQKIKAGIINWNSPLTGASSAAPFGGIGQSGNFRPSAYYAADYCSYPVASMENQTVIMPTKLSPGIQLT